ncbi:MAG TPA: tetratricopeptide repeat protein [Nitrospiria bacterium]|nr:tetratricopeptide repeat protein [Nitrospiria bacterium]
MALVLIVILIVGVLFTLVWPLRQRAEPLIPLGPEAAGNQERVDLELEREILLSSLAELEVDRVRDKLPETDYQRLKATDERRLLQVLEKLDALAATEKAATSGRRPAAPVTTAQTRQSLHWPAMSAVALFVLIGAALIYLQLFAMQQARATALQQQMARNMPDPKEMVARLEARLKENPNDLQGQIMAGRSYMALERPGDALRAWAKVVELDPKNAEAHFNIGVILLTTRKTDDPKVFQEAMDHFDIAYAALPQEPALLWYRGIVFVHQNRLNDADAAWTAAYQNLQPGSDDSKFVRQALEQLRAGKPPLY